MGSLSLVDQNKELPLYIDGEYIKTEESIPINNKYTGEIIASISKASRQHVTQAVDAAERNYLKDSLTPVQRYSILLKSAELMEERREEFERSLVKEVGKTRKDAKGELDRTINTLRLSAEEAKRIAGEMVPLQATEGSENRIGFTIRVPNGVIGVITPFNYPLLLGVHKVAPAIAAGNTIVIKPATSTPLATFMLVDLMEEAGLPRGYINIITGAGSEVGEWLLAEERIAMYTFTGSGEVGKHIKENSGLRPVALELGNNSPNIVHKDADLDIAARLTASRSFHNAGQACIAVQRLYVQKEVFDEFTQKYVEHVKQLNIGDPEKEETDVGPMISEKEAIRTEEWVREAVSQGARPLVEIKREGALFHPAVLVDTKPDMKVVCQEVFAPVVCIVPYGDVQEAFEAANASDYGLQAGIFTKDLQLAMRAAKVLQYGGVVINDVSTYRNDVMPYGGIKNSGIGKEGPRYAIQELTDERMVVMNL
ncbi:aldehyde dehydrogenase family protein [Fictibacillus fluitans]|uniref:Aldehyde dehydrogenase family protein n=1 Tax=Fictibacillus fluitans TaxID=3058422 RepID=A0ABT8HQA8_9BACL|nr:aldehyde dehydrogenase family protein [Fictibacillus sp. NE201]MDN4522941.1 aldehyde dehydrogenase family protein [Fictibacillus sp. NE201]